MNSADHPEHFRTRATPSQVPPDPSQDPTTDIAPADESAAVVDIGKAEESSETPTAPAEIEQELDASLAQDTAAPESVEDESPSEGPSESSATTVDGLRDRWKEKFGDEAETLLNIVETAKKESALEEERLKNPPPIDMALCSPDPEAPELIPDLIPELVPRTGMTCFVGEHGHDGSRLAAEVAAAITQERPCGDGQPATKGKVILITAGDLQSTVTPGLHRQGADTLKVLIHGLGSDTDCPETLDLLEHQHVIRRRLRQHPETVAVIVDKPELFIKTKDAGRIQRHLSRLVVAFSRQKVALILFTTMRGIDDKSESEILAQLVFASQAARVWGIGQDYRFRDRRSLYPLPQENPNALLREWEYDVKGKLIWRPSSDSQPSSSRVGRRQGAATALVAELESGPKMVNDILASLLQLGFKDRTVHRAKELLNIVSEREGKGWQWRLLD